MTEISPGRKSFWPFVLPLLVYLTLGLIEPRFATDGHAEQAAMVQQAATPGQLLASAVVPQPNQQSQSAHAYVWFYTARIAVTALLVLVFFRYYRRQFPFRLSWLAIAFGIVGAALWIGVCQLQIEKHLLGAIGMSEQVLGSRSQFNPWEHYSSAIQLAGVLAVRFFGLVLIVPIMEEVFLRGFLVRVMEQPDWWNVRLNQLDRLALLSPCLYGALTHPGEIFAAILWFGLVTLLMVRTANLWDCVLAHAVTNLLLGLYVVTFSQWQLW